MASLRRRHGSPYWTACITDSNGKQKQFSTKEKNKAAALVIAQSAEEDPQSDIDYMIVFADSDAKPQAYLDRLRRFAEARYTCCIPIPC